jgi:hypothetical protein
VATAPPPLFTAPTSAAGSSVAPMLFALVREIRADVQDFDLSLERIASAAAAAVTAGSTAGLESAEQSERPLIEALRNKVDEALARIKQDVFARDAQVWSDCGDEVTHIDNLWSRVVAETSDLSDPAQIAQRIARVREFLRSVLIHTARLTVADRLNGHLATVRIGKAIGFDAAFSDELPNADDRREILKYLADHPGSVSGVIDVARGLVFRVSQSRKVRLATYAAPLLAAAAGAGVVVIAGELDNWLNLSGWPHGMRNASALLTGYFFVLIGALVHVAVETLKQQRFSAGTSFLALDDLLDWVHIRYLSISASVLWVLVGIFGLAASSTSINWTTAFFVGYSIDSLGGLFLQRFGQAVDRKTKALSDDLGASAQAAVTQH